MAILNVVEGNVYIQADTAQDILLILAGAEQYILTAEQKRDIETTPIFVVPDDIDDTDPLDDEDEELEEDE